MLPRLAFALLSRSFATPLSNTADSQTPRRFNKPDSVQHLLHTKRRPVFSQTLHCLYSSQRRQSTSIRLSQQPANTRRIMTQPLPFGTKETGGWWARPRPFITLPSVVGSVCGHTLSGATVPPRRNSIPAADTTHCSKCMLVEEIPTDQPSNSGFPTVIAFTCRHALSGIDTHIGPTTVPAAATRLCATCTSFSKIVQEVSASHKEWQDSVRAYNWAYFATALKLRSPDFRHPTEDDIVSDPMFKDYLAGRRSLARCHERLRALYEQTVYRLQKSVDPALPIVNLDGVALLSAHENGLDIPPQAVQVTLRRVKFDERQQHPSRETARGQLQYRRIQRGQAYRPGRYAEPTGRGWEDTSSPALY